MVFKKNIIATVDRVHEEAVTNNGKIVRDIDVTARGPKRDQHYRLTEVALRPQRIRVGQEYNFTVFVNGLRIRQDHVNKLCITDIVALR